MKRGWAGFEKEFDYVVPRDRADYAHVKRDMLCGPIFSVKAYRNIADAVLGRKTVDEMFDEMAGSRSKSPSSGTADAIIGRGHRGGKIH
jgi:hypothetical protein